MSTAPPVGDVRLEPTGWSVPLAVTVAVVVGAAVALTIRTYVNPSGVVQNTFGTPLGEQLNTQIVAVLFGAPYAALAAALVSYVGVRRARPVVYAAVGVIAGVLVFAVFGFEAVSIGQWWVSSVPADTNEAAAMFTFLLVPPGALATQLAAYPVPIHPSMRRAGVAARSVLVGVMLGLVLGSLLASLTAGVTWAINCPQNGYTNCFTLSSVLDSALLIGTLAGMAIGAVTGTIAWLLRIRPTSSEGSPQ